MMPSLIYPFLAALIAFCSAKVWQIPIPQQLQDCYNRVEHSDVRSFVGSTYSWLCESGIRQTQLKEPQSFGARQSSYYKGLYDKSVEFVAHSSGHGGFHRAKRQADGRRCIRKEYRMLTDEERVRFHNAVNALKQDTSVEPNKYDAIALLHTGMASFTAHGGAGFPGWHRIYILMFETALREVDPTVCLPYWDSSLDSSLEDPTNSHIWTEDFFGTSQGAVTEGPFAGWMTPEGVQLMRNVGSDGDLFTVASIEDILSKQRHAEIITHTEVDPRFDMEFHHAAVHVFCGGAMGQLDTAAFDPIFFIHHAFVDYLWELFRTNMRGLGLDPEVYPDVHEVDSRHHSSQSTGFGDLTQADGYLDSLADSYEYESAPICTSRFPECGSKYLRCLDTIGRCVPINPDTRPPKPDIRPPNPDTRPPIPDPKPPHPTPKPNPDQSSCPRRFEEIYGQPVQNSYCCDKTCDTNQWAMIPVKIINVRPPKFGGYNSFPVSGGRVDRSFDIYSPKAYTQTNRYISSRLGNPKTFTRCNHDNNAGQVFISSKGLNYDGYYKEAAVVDHRLAVSISMGFVAVKKPSRGNLGTSKAIVRVHDSCGRVCHAACKDPTSGEYVACSGAIAVSNDTPLMFGTNYDEAVMAVFDYSFNNDCPSFKTENFFLTFYCDYHNSFPYAHHTHGSQAPSHKPPPKPVVPVQLPSSSTGCQVTRQCVLDVPCASTFHQCTMFNEKHRCRGSCQAYGVCTYGRYFLRLCPNGQYFDDATLSCVTGACRKVPGQERILGHGGPFSNSNVPVQSHGHGHAHVISQGHTHVISQGHGYAGSQGHGHAGSQSHGHANNPGSFQSNPQLSYINQLQARLNPGTSGSHHGHNTHELPSAHHAHASSHDAHTNNQPSQTKKPFYSSLMGGFMRNFRNRG